MSVRIVSIDWYLSRIEDHAVGSRMLSEALSELPRSLRQNKVPIVRIFGPTSGGQKCCVHLHGVLPYFFVPLPKHLPTESAWVCADAIHRGLERAMQASMAPAPNSTRTDEETAEERDAHRFVFEVCPLTRKNIYGFHQSQIFLKITAFNPALISRMASLCASGALREFGPLQPFESHLSFILQVGY